MSHWLIDVRWVKAVKCITLISLSLVWNVKHANEAYAMQMCPCRFSLPRSLTRSEYRTAICPSHWMVDFDDFLFQFTSCVLIRLRARARTCACVCSHQPFQFKDQYHFHIYQFFFFFCLLLINCRMMVVSIRIFDLTISGHWYLPPSKQWNCSCCYFSSWLFNIHSQFRYTAIDKVSICTSDAIVEIKKKNLKFRHEFQG